jgi:uncharacterized protein
MAPLVINQKFPAVGRSGREPTDAVLKAAEMFGIGLDESYEVTLYDRLALDVRPGDVVFVTGPSGSGKSVLLGRLREALGVAWPDAAVADLAAVTLSGERPVIDLFEGPLERRLRVLSTAGLADAFLLLRTPAELSDGQRYRLKLALAIQQCGMRSGECGVEKEHAVAESLPFTPHSALRTPHLLVADEFCSTLDRLCARAIAYRVRRLADAEGLTILAASAHDDLIEDLAPDVLVTKHEGPRVAVRYADPARPSTDPMGGVQP